MELPRREIAESAADYAKLESDVISALQSQLESLRIRVKELEFDNAKLSSLVSTCRCHKEEENIVGGKSRRKKGKQKMQDYNSMTGLQFPKRYVALKVMYFGKRFFGFASEGNMDPTVESEIFRALEKTRLINGGKKDLQYSRCGRTDKGVSSVGQVISLFLRSNHKEPEPCNGFSGGFEPKGHYEGERDYVRILNRVLPKDIRIMGWCPAPTDFNARFSCLSREYKYFFWKGNLNTVAMENAGKKFIGEHDFRNFCKMDAANVHNYRRRISLFEIVPSNERFEGDQLWAVKIKGTAFLWHQVRCMVAVLFLIGQGLESPDVIDSLLDIERTPRKPQYVLAPEIPLILHSCNFEGLKFMCSSDAWQALHAHLEMECRTYKLQATIFNEALPSYSMLENGAQKHFIFFMLNLLFLALSPIAQRSLSFSGGSLSNNKAKKKPASYVPLLSRPTESSYEERCRKLSSGAQD